MWYSHTSVSYKDAHHDLSPTGLSAEDTVFKDFETDSSTSRQPNSTSSSQMMLLAPIWKWLKMATSRHLFNNHMFWGKVSVRRPHAMPSTHYASYRFLRLCPLAMRLHLSLIKSILNSVGVTSVPSAQEVRAHLRFFLSRWPNLSRVVAVTFWDQRQHQTDSPRAPWTSLFPTHQELYTIITLNK